MFGLGEMRNFEHSAVKTDALQVSQDGRIAVCTSGAIRIMFPLVSNIPKTKCEIDDTFILFVDEPEGYLDLLKELPTDPSLDNYRYSSVLATSGFRSCVWSPLGCAYNGGCLLLAITQKYHVRLFSHVRNMLHGEYVMIQNVSDTLAGYLRTNNLLSRDNIEVTAAFWSASILYIGSKSGLVFMAKLSLEEGTVEIIGHLEAHLNDWISCIAEEPSSGGIFTASSSGQVKYYRVITTLRNNEESTSIITESFILEEQDMRPVIFLKSIGHRLFIAKSNTVNVFDITSNSEEIGAKKAGYCILEQSMNISALHIASSTEIYVFSQNGICAAFIELDEEWIIDTSRTSRLYKSIQEIGMSKDSTEDSNPRNGNEETVERENDEEEGQELSKFCVLPGKKIPRFMGAHISFNGLYLSICFDAIGIAEAVYRPNNQLRLNFCVLPIYQSSCMQKLNPARVFEISDNHWTFYSLLWDILSISNVHDCLKSLENYKVEPTTVKYLQALSYDDSNDELMLKHLESLSNYNLTALKILSEQENISPNVQIRILQHKDELDKLSYGTCEICDSPFILHSLSSVKCTDEVGHVFSLCVESLKPLSSFEEILYCISCKRKRINNSTPENRLCSFCGCILTYVI